MAGIIIPKTYVERVNEPLIFLAGPIRSAPNWQDTAIELLFAKRNDISVASPRRGRTNDLGNITLPAQMTSFPGNGLGKGIILTWPQGPEQ